MYRNPSTNPEVLDTSYGLAASSWGFGRLRKGRFWTLLEYWLQLDRNLRVMGLLDDEMNRRRVAADEMRLRELEDRDKIAVYGDEVLSLIEDFMIRLSPFGPPRPSWNWIAWDPHLTFCDPPGKANPLTGANKRLVHGVGVVVPHREQGPGGLRSDSLLGPSKAEKRRLKRLSKEYEKRNLALWEEFSRGNPGPHLAVQLGASSSRADWLSVDYRLRGNALREQIIQVVQKGHYPFSTSCYWLQPPELAEKMVTYLDDLRRLTAT